MSSLRNIQQQFANALTLHDCHGITPNIVKRGVSAERRMRIYRNNVRENFAAALATGFPVLRKLVGEQYFRQMAIEYQRECPSKSGNLFYTGDRLAAFLDRQLTGSEYEYFGDIARLEWLCQESGIADDPESLSIEMLNRVDEADYARLRLQLHPAARLLRSRYPLMRIWQQNQPGNTVDQPIDLSTGNDRLLIRCVGSETELRQLSDGEFLFLQALQARSSLQEALTSALTVNQDFALSDQLKKWVSLNVISNFSIQCVKTSE